MLAAVGRRDQAEPSSPALGTDVDCMKSSYSVVLPSVGAVRGGLIPCRSLLPFTGVPFGGSHG